MNLQNRVEKLEHRLDPVPSDDSDRGLVLSIGKGHLAHISQRVLDGGFIDRFNRTYGNFTPDSGERKAA